MKKQLLALAILSAAIFSIGTADAQRGERGVRTTAPNVIIYRNEKYFLNRADSFFQNLAEEHKGIVVIRRTEVTPVGKVIAQYKNPKFGKNGKIGGKELEVVEVRYVKGKSAVPGSDLRTILNQIKAHFAELRKENQRILNIRTSAGTQAIGTEIISFKNPIASKKGLVGSELETVSVEFIGKNGKLMGLKQRPTEEYTGLTKEQQQELENNPAMRIIGGGKDEQTKVNAAVKADQVKRAIINSQRYGIE
jgi:hypothetical protein